MVNSLLKADKFSIFTKNCFDTFGAASTELLFPLHGDQLHPPSQHQEKEDAPVDNHRNLLRGKASLVFGFLCLCLGNAIKFGKLFFCFFQFSRDE